MINVSWEETQMEIKPGITLNNTNKWTKNMKVNFIKIEKHDRNLGQGFMKKMKEAWHDIYKNSEMSNTTYKRCYILERQIVIQP